MLLTEAGEIILWKEIDDTSFMIMKVKQVGFLEEEMSYCKAVL